MNNGSSSQGAEIRVNQRHRITLGSNRLRRPRRDTQQLPASTDTTARMLKLNTRGRRHSAKILRPAQHSDAAEQVATTIVAAVRTTRGDRRAQRSIAPLDLFAVAFARIIERVPPNVRRLPERGESAHRVSHPTFDNVSAAIFTRLVRNCFFSVPADGGHAQDHELLPLIPQ